MNELRSIKDKLWRQARNLPGFLGVGLMTEPGRPVPSLVLHCENPDADWAVRLQLEGFEDVPVRVRKASPPELHSQV